MKKAYYILCCIAGSSMIGYFSGQLHSIAGTLFFTIGVAVLIGSIAFLTKERKS